MNVSKSMQSCIEYGFAVHLIGIFADSSMLFRVRSTNRKFRLIALVAVSVYTCLFIAWLVALHVVRYNNVGKVCSGDFLTDQSNGKS